MTMTDAPPAPDTDAPEAPPSEPARGRGRPPGSTTKKTRSAPGRPSNADKLTKDLTASLAMVGLGAMAFNQVDGMAIMGAAPDTAIALVKMGERNPKMMAALQSLTAASAYGELFKALAVMLIPILVNHNALPVTILEHVPVDPDIKTMLKMSKAGPEQMPDVADLADIMSRMKPPDGPSAA